MVEVLYLQKDTQIAVEIFDMEGRQDGRKQSLYTYKVMIQKLLDAKHHEEAKNLLNEMTAESFRCSDIVVFNNLIKSYSQALLLEPTFKVFDQINNLCKPYIDS